MRYFLRLGYNGSDFHGWQRQPNASSVQQTLEEALGIILRKETEITGAGRTDTGVNAREMYAHFDVLSPIQNKQAFLRSLNMLAGKNIACYDLLEVTEDAHARFDALSRTYKYFISTEKSPFLYSLSTFIHRELDVKAMNEAAVLLLEEEDFTSFAKLHSDAKTNICNVSEAYWECLDFHNNAFMPGLFTGYVFTIRADRFLRNMVRAIVGTLIDVGMGKLTNEDFIRIIKEKDRCSAGTSVEPQGLYLWEIKYSYIN